MAEDYTDLNTLKAYLRISSGTDDVLLSALITRASRVVDLFTGRWFVTRTETRRYDAQGVHIAGPLLLLDADLLSVTAIRNGDGAAIDPQAHVTLRPVNWPPYFGISLKESSGLEWTFSGDAEAAIEVTGQWGYAAAIPGPVTQATVRLVAWMYRQRDGGESLLVHRPGISGPDSIGAAVPYDVRDILMPYVRLRIKALG